MINHAIVGCGRIAASHTDAFEWAGSAVVSCTDVLIDQARSFAQRANVPQVADSFESLLQDPRITSISLCVPHDLHASMTLQALAAGKHVLVEKPAVLNPDDGEKIITAMKASGRVVMPVVQHRFDPLVVEIVSLLAAGALGDLRFIRAHLECVRPPEYYRDSDWRGLWAREGGSVLINQGYHLLDLMLLSAGPVSAVSAEMATFAPSEIMETEDAVAATLRFQGGALASLTINGASGSIWKTFIELMGSEGELAFDINYPNALTRFQLKNKSDLQQWRKRFNEASEVKILAPPGLDYYGVSHRYQARAFIELIEGKQSPNAATFQEALDTVTIARQIYECARRSQTQAPESQFDSASAPVLTPTHARVWDELWKDVRSDDVEKIAALIMRGETSIVAGGLLDEFETDFANYCGSGYGVAFCNGTASLYAALWALGVRADDDVLICDYGFVGMAAAILSLGARMVVCDCLADSLLLDPEEIRRHRTPRTKAILVHNPWGLPAMFDRIRGAADGIPILSDASHAHGAFFRQQPIAAWADITCFSLGRFKLISGGELGCAVTDNVELRDRMLIFGHPNRVPLALHSSPWRGNSVGIKFRPHPVSLSLALSQLGRIDEKLKLSRAACSRLEGIFRTFGFLPQALGQESVRSYWKLIFQIDERWTGIPTRKIENELKRRGLPLEGNHYWPLLQDQEISRWPDYQDKITRNETPVAHSVVQRTITLNAPVNLSEDSFVRTAEILQSLPSRF